MDLPKSVISISFASHCNLSPNNASLLTVCVYVCICVYVCMPAGALTVTSGIGGGSPS